MSYGIYKPGQGYWTRVMTACGGGLLALAAGAWIWGQLSAIETSFPVLYLQAGVAGAIILAATAFLYWIVAVKPRTVEFFIATEGEMQKVNWSSRREILGSTWVVIGVSLIIAAVLFFTDLLFSTFFKSIDLLQ
jgi:preprotein translocase SecE subunit